MPRETLIQKCRRLGHELAAAKKLVQEHLSDASAARVAARVDYDKRREAEAQLVTINGSLADLKERLHQSEMELARLRGYLERVREDDVVRDELVEMPPVHTDGPAQLVPKRHLSLPPAMPYEHNFDGLLGQRRKHWTSY